MKTDSILILSNSFTGLYSFRRELIKKLLDNRYKVIISAPFDSMTSYFQSCGCEVLDTRFNRRGTNPIKDSCLLISYVRLLKKIKPRIVLSYTIKPNLYGGMASAICCIPQIANITGLGSAVENPGWLQSLSILLYKVGLRKASTVFFQNRSNLEFCVKHRMVKGKTKLIPGSGVNLQYHCFQKYPAKDDSLRFIFISRLLREKGIEEFLSAAIIIKEKYPKVEFHILGGSEDDYAEKINRLQNDGIVIYHGKQPDVRPFIGQSCCTVHPSYYPEGMSNVLLESCAAGRPIITTNRPGCGEIVEDGVNGYIANAQDSIDVASKIERFINLPYKQKCEMGLAARRKVEREFDRRIVVEAYMKELSSIIHV